MELSMQCNCDEEDFREAEARRLRVFERMGVTRMDHLILAVLLSLAWDFSCDDADVCADQWFGVGVSTSLVPEGLFVPCDDVADGFLAIWEELARRFPERVTTNARHVPESVEIARRVSAALMRHYEEVERAYVAHRKADHVDENDWDPRCVDCAVGLSLRSRTMIAITDEWGERVVDAAVEASFDRRNR